MIESKGYDPVRDHSGTCAKCGEVIAEYIDGDTPRLELGKAALATIDHIDALSGR